MDTKDTVANGGFSGAITIESVDDLFQLYFTLVAPLKRLEDACAKESELRKNMENAQNTIKKAFAMLLSRTLKSTVVLLVPFIIFFLIIGNVLHTPDGIKWLDAFLDWAGETPLGAWAGNGLASLLTNSDGALTILGALLVPLLFYVLMPCVTLLLPAMLVLSAARMVFSVIFAKVTLEKCRKELPRAEGQVEKMVKKLSPALAFVPPDYRYSAAVEYFYKSYHNEKASTLKEAVNLYDNYMHQVRMEQKQQEILQAQCRILSALDYQSAKIDALEKKMDSLKLKVDCL